MTITQINVTLTTDAQATMENYLTADDEPTAGIRVSIKAGGCSGFKYALTVEQEPLTDDIVVKQGEVRLFIDPFSAQYLDGLTIGYKSSMEGSGFTFKNPQSTGGCGCGSSFSA
jgi:iron-sulfur cluster assembly accessory protein